MFKVTGFNSRATQTRYPEGVTFQGLISGVEEKEVEQKISIAITILSPENAAGKQVKDSINEKTAHWKLAKLVNAAGEFVAGAEVSPGDVLRKLLGKRIAWTFKPSKDGVYQNIQYISKKTDAAMNAEPPTAEPPAAVGGAQSSPNPKPDIEWAPF